MRLQEKMQEMKEVHNQQRIHSHSRIRQHHQLVGWQAVAHSAVCRFVP